ncbi:GNAT family N-acetyltransferase [Frigidibacter albus]|uniref:GNAT family N-acetyltransferase n=1 Tax=Frigidibacter albus TaxID=1465486 RepID=A0A6L8VKJ8_9RHOB|nr:bifunctional helix-turn-helix transcriptional regulator/GNAT family N-acetyltransferase [Frigidibacter albus]MZQ89899.1 GNAT family N-acetyltransferase [Frigidibacter albus]NBE31726.1 GNAT family N-acetyltransferase [Frigidibacter albus]GGH56100.1 GNAT family N-acetyltransferase [Frigidibacter albus]
MIPADDIDALRAFNRVYTNRLGLLDTKLDNSPFTLSEARVLYELANRTDLTGAELARTLRMDPGQISRTIKRFVARDLVAARDDPAHGRHQLLSLTDQGRSTYAALEQSTCTAMGALLETLPPVRRDSLRHAAETLTRIFTDTAPPQPVLRGLRPGDLGLVASRQAMLYAQEYGWTAEFEALAARILADFHTNFDPACEDGWIAEIDGQMVGSVFLVRGEAGAGKLRLLYVEPAARGQGIGDLLVRTCIERARAAGYTRLDLWTNSVLGAARRIYQRAGFVLLEEVPHHSFGHDLIGESWSLAL